MRRTLGFSLGLANASKIKAIENLYQEYQKAVNCYLQILADKNQHILSEREVKSYESLLSYRYKQCAKKQAIKIYALSLFFF